MAMNLVQAPFSSLTFSSEDSDNVETDGESWTPVVGKKKSSGIKDQHGRTKKFPGKDNPGASEMIRRLD